MSLGRQKRHALAAAVLSPSTIYESQAVILAAHLTSHQPLEVGQALEIPTRALLLPLTRSPLSAALYPHEPPEPHGRVV